MLRKLRSPVAATLALALLGGGSARADAAPGRFSAGAQLIQAGAPLTPGRDDVQFGRAISLSADGNTAVIDGRQAGATWVFVRSGMVWALETVLRPPDRRGTTETTSAAISADGQTVIVGASTSGDGERGGPGAAWIYTRGSGGWDLRVRLDPYANGGPARFGSAAALSADGRVALVASEGNDLAWVFERQGDAWIATGKLIGNHSGTAVQLTADGSIAMLGGQTFVRQGADWARVDQLALTGSLRMSADGGTVLRTISRPVTGEPGGNTVEVLSRTDAGWVQTAVLSPSDPSTGASFGTSAALSGDGSVALIGGGTPGNTGSAWLFVRDQAGWRQVGARMYSAELSLGFAMSVELSSDGTTALLGGSESRVWSFAEGATVTGVAPASGPRSGGTRVVLTGTGFTDVRAVTFGTVPATSFRVISPTQLAVMSPPGPASSVHVTVSSTYAVSRTTGADRFLWRTPVVSLGSGGLVLRLARPSQRIACRRTECRGTIRLVRGPASLARASFRIAEGRSARIGLRVTAAGHRARRRHLRSASLVVAVDGALPIRRRVALR